MIERKDIALKDKMQVKLDEVSMQAHTIKSPISNVEEILKNHGFSNITFIGSGWSSEAYNAIYDSKDYIIRIPKVGGDGFKEYKREHALLEILANKISSVKIPKTYLYESAELNFVAHEKIIGNTFNINSFDKLSHEEQDNFSQSTANFFNEIHSIDINDVSNINGLHWGNLSTDYIIKSFKRYLDFFKKEGWEENLNFTKREIDAFCKLIDSISNIKEPKVLLHRDFHGENFVVDDKMHLTGVFDFGNCSIAERAIEFNPFIKKNPDGTFYEPLLLKKLLFFYEQASGVHIAFNDIVNQVKYSDAYCITWLVCSDNILYNNKDNLRDCVKRIKKWLGRDMEKNL